MAQQRKVGSRDEIADAAIRLIDDQGLHALTMRRVGAALGVEAMTLYRYVRSREDLLDAVHSRLMEQVRIPALSGDWIADTSSFARGFRMALMAHPNTLPIIATRPATGAPALRLLEAAMQTVPLEVMDENAALDVVQTLFVFVVGHCSFHAAMATDGSPEVQLDSRSHPRLSAIDPSTPEREFESGLTLIGAGLRAVHGS